MFKAVLVSLVNIVKKFTYESISFCDFLGLMFQVLDPV